MRLGPLSRLFSSVSQVYKFISTTRMPSETISSYGSWSVELASSRLAYYPTLIELHQVPALWFVLCLFCLLLAEAGCRVAEALHTSFTWTYLYRLTVRHYGDIDIIIVHHWTLGLSAIFNGFIGATVQVCIHPSCDDSLNNLSVRRPGSRTGFMCCRSISRYPSCPGQALLCR